MPIYGWYLTCEERDAFTVLFYSKVWLFTDYLLDSPVLNNIGIKEDI